MHSLESKTHSFIVKMWLEETVNDPGRVKWRGHITHVPDGKRRYLGSPDGIPPFITPYLKGAGGKVKSFARMRQWLSRRK
jgi:hypothetical protein